MSDDLQEKPTYVEPEWIEEPDHLPPPTSRFFTVWIVASFLVLLVRLGPALMADKISGEVLLFALPGCLLVGWAVTGSALIINYWRRGFVWTLEPGQWMLLCLAWSLVPDLAMMLCRVLGFTTASLGISEWGPALSLGVVTLPWLVAAQLEEERSLWSGLFLVIALNLLWLTVVCILVALKIEADWIFRAPWIVLAPLIVLSPLIPLLVLLGIRQDRRRNIQRDWLHWSGIITFILMGALLTLVVLTMAISPLPTPDFPPQQPGFQRLR